MKTATEILASLRADLADFAGDRAELLREVVELAEEEIANLPHDETDGNRCSECWEYADDCCCNYHDSEEDPDSWYYGMDETDFWADN